MRKLLSVFVLIPLFVFAGCANPGVTMLTPGVYILNKADRAGIFGNAAALKAEVLTEANEFAASKGKAALPLTLKETPIGGPGQFARVEYQFRLVDKDDPRLETASLRRGPDVVIDRTDKIDARITNKPEKDTYTELVRLDDLRKRGIITEAEFEAQKRKVLGN